MLLVSNTIIDVGILGKNKGFLAPGSLCQMNGIRYCFCNSFALLSGIYDIKTLTSYFISFVVFFFVFHSFIIAINKKKQQTIENKLNEDEMNE